jgi:hypothetical protein
VGELVPEQHAIVWDLETVPDLEAAARVLDMEGQPDQQIRAALGPGFPKHPLHKIVCIGALIAGHHDEERDPCSSFSRLPHAIVRIATQFLKYLGQNLTMTVVTNIDNAPNVDELRLPFYVEFSRSMFRAYEWGDSWLAVLLVAASEGRRMVTPPSGSTLAAALSFSRSRDFVRQSDHRESVLNGQFIINAYVHTTFVYSVSKELPLRRVLG